MSEQDWDKNVLKALTVKFYGHEREIMIKAFESYPTLKKDCKLERQRKEFLRLQYYNREVNKR